MLTTLAAVGVLVDNKLARIMLQVSDADMLLATDQCIYWETADD